MVYLFFYLLLFPTLTDGQCSPLGVQADYQYIINGSEDYFERVYYSNNKSVSMTLSKTSESHATTTHVSTLSRNYSFVLDTGSIIHKLYDTQQMISGQRVFGLEIKYYEEPIQGMTWQYTNESKYIDSLLCFKATGTFRCSEYVVWFTTDIPGQIAPWKIHSLPGTVVSAENTTYPAYWQLKQVTPFQDPTHRLWHTPTPEGSISLFFNRRSEAIENLRKIMATKNNDGCNNCTSTKLESVKQMECADSTLLGHKR